MKYLIPFCLLLLCSCESDIERKDIQNIENHFRSKWDTLLKSEHGYSIAMGTTKGFVAVVNGDAKVNGDSFTQIGEIRPLGPYTVVPSLVKVKTLEQAIIEAKRCYKIRLLLKPNNEPD